jgi:hypothetical protein
MTAIFGPVPDRQVPGEVRRPHQFGDDVMRRNVAGVVGRHRPAAEGGDGRGGWRPAAGERSAAFRPAAATGTRS